MNHIRKGLLLTALFLALAPTALASTTWYVNGVSGSGSNNCMPPLTACKTIGHAVSLAASGDSIKVGAATYAENLTVSTSLKILGSGARTTIIDGGGSGQVLNISSGHVTLSAVTVRNGAQGISNGGALLVIASTISGNRHIFSCSLRQSCRVEGGGIYNSNLATLTIRSSTIVGNSVQGSCPNPFQCSVIAFGGGISNHGNIIISNSTLSSNTASTNFGSGFGGGISNSGTAVISNSSLSGNAANHGSDILNSTGFTVKLQNSIVANSSSGGNCGGAPVLSNGYNLSSDNTCNFGGSGDLNNTDPQLGPLQYNGGPTQTMALPSGSPAVDAGNPNGCTDGQGHLLKTDQRGQPRPDKEDTGGCDMGAYERQGD